MEISFKYQIGEDVFIAHNETIKKVKVTGNGFFEQLNKFDKVRIIRKVYCDDRSNYFEDQVASTKEEAEQILKVQKQRLEKMVKSYNRQ